ncbi:MAG: type I restriction enzyme HsdR N-terminal domain-containing protein [Bacteroidia bacterium]|nr:type I restriction enzyme HsdR N-terminal domain-containing protein [Bacteroidia bacterium]MDW8159203.1 type I restriction enzyme HsdR N-terminal domain-containing protein [Bacteroidia bacterium]
MNLLPLPENFIDHTQKQVWDFIRKKYVKLTPEEEVRQSLIHTLVRVYHYPSSLLGLEKKITYGRQIKRYDLLLYSRKGKPLLLAECKAKNVKISRDSILQIAAYNTTIGARYLLLTNGKDIISVDTLKAEIFTKILPFGALET